MQVLFERGRGREFSRRNLASVAALISPPRRHREKNFRRCASLLNGFAASIFSAVLGPRFSGGVCTHQLGRVRDVARCEAPAGMAAPSLNCANVGIFHGLYCRVLTPMRFSVSRLYHALLGITGPAKKYFVQRELSVGFVLPFTWSMSTGRRAAEITDSPAGGRGSGWLGISFARSVISRAGFIGSVLHSARARPEGSEAFAWRHAAPDPVRLSRERRPECPHSQ